MVAPLPLAAAPVAYGAPHAHQWLDRSDTTTTGFGKSQAVNKAYRNQMVYKENPGLRNTEVYYNNYPSSL